MQYLLLVILVIIAYMSVIQMRRFYLNYLLRLLKDENYHLFKSKLQRFITPFLVEPFIVDLLAFNCAILENDQHKIETYLDIFEKRNLKYHEKIEIYTKAFKYYILTKDQDKIDKYYALLKSSGYQMDEIERIYQNIKTP